MVFVLGVVAVLHEAAYKFTKAQDDVDAAAGVVEVPEPVQVLACPLLPLGRRFPVTSQDLPFLEVDMDGMAVASARRLKMPNLGAGLCRRRGEPPGIRAEAGAAADLDRKGFLVGAARAAELEGAMDGVVDFLLGEGRKGDHRLLAGDEVRRVHALVGVRIGMHP